MSTESEQLDQLPDAIVERLRARDGRLAILTPRVDSSVREAVESHFAPRARTVRRRWHVPAAAAAAAVLVALLIARPFDDAELGSERLADDIDGSGRVDILDVFALARAAEASPGSVSQERIVALGERIVALIPSQDDVL